MRWFRAGAGVAKLAVRRSLSTSGSYNVTRSVVPAQNRYLHTTKCKSKAEAAPVPRPVPLSRLTDSFLDGTSSVYLEGLQRAWEADPNSVDESWDNFFRNFVGQASTSPGISGQTIQESMRLLLLVRAYQVNGHMKAKLDPLGLEQRDIPDDLDPALYGFTEADLDREFFLGVWRMAGFLSENRPVQTLRSILTRLEQAYCGSIGYEYMHIADRNKCNWLRDKIETPTTMQYNRQRREVILDRLIWSTQFENFLATKWTTAKRFGLEGCETLIPGMKEMFDRAADLGVESIVIGMPHRGRLNVLGNVVRKPLRQIFSEFSGGTKPVDEVGLYTGTGDVKYHLGTSYDRPTRGGKRIHLSLVANPSHLEAVDPVVVGKTRAKQYYSNDVDRTKNMGVLIHGDGSFAGQGVVYETLHLSALPNYTTGGTIHIVVNNQVAFTTDPMSGRSSEYCTDVAKALNVPIFHVNADDMEAVVHVCELAAEWRQTFHSDVVVDLVCYRRFGHNEIDEPSFTQPKMYKVIRNHPNPLTIYKNKLLESGQVAQEDIERIQSKVTTILNEEFLASKDYVPQRRDWLSSHWSGFKSPEQLSRIRNTGVKPEILKNVGKAITALPENFKPHRAVKKVYGERAQMIETGEGIDWAVGEALAFATLLVEGNHVRLSGQDVERGTFSHRHAVLHDQETGERYCPLDHVIANQDEEMFTVSNSSLSEFGVLGFELGYSMENPNALVIWEAQFGDFANGAQVIFDQFLGQTELALLLLDLLPSMAKPRKPKNEDAKPENSGPLVRHQKLCLSIDLALRRIYGYTELKITVPEIGIVGLHAENLGIESVSVDGEPAEFEYYPHSNNRDSESERDWSSVMSPSSAADVAGSCYISALERELVPNLLINCCKALKAGSEAHEQMVVENEAQQSSEEAKQNLRLIRIDYWVEKAETGIYFRDNVLHTDNQMRRARCWFPCMDDSSQSCCYDLEFTVARHLVAVSTGTLLYQVLSKDDPPRKTYVYRLDVPVSAQWISLVVAPFEILPDHQCGLISHMCLPAHLSKLRNTVEFFHGAFSCYKDYLAVNFPFGSYKQVFIEPEMAVSSLSSGASMSIFSSQVLFDEKIIDQTIDTRIKLAFALARQWFGVYITPEAPNDEWLLDGLAGFLTDLFIKKYLGNNEARYRRYKANCAVCSADDSGATALSSTASCKDLFGTQCIGIYSKIRSWKSVAILQMLEKQMGPESFRKILQTIVSRAQDKNRSLRSLSTKEFRHFANKVGNLERPFLKEFFPRWVELCGCPLLRMGFSYNKRKNMVEVAVLRGCTEMSDSSDSTVNTNSESEKRNSDSGWPGMMSIRVHELDGTFDHPVLPMAGETVQLLEIQCHSKLAARRFQKPKKGSKVDGADDNGDATPALDIRSSMESPLLWMRADPEMEYLAEIHFNQPVQMWINQLEKDKDVVAQAQAIAMLETLPQLPFSVVNALNNFLVDSKAFWRVRIEAAFALANTSSEDTDWAGLLHLVTFYKSRRFDANIGLPKPNDFHDIPEYLVLEAIPHAVAMVRAADKKSPREAVEFVLQLFKYNDNNGNSYSDVFWLSSLIQSVGELEFGQQSIVLLSSLLKRIDRLLQFDRLMPSYNGILSVSCIRSLTHIALKLLGFVPLDRVFELVKPFRDIKAIWQVRVEASKALLDLEFHCKGIDAALALFLRYLDEEPSFRGQVKLAVHAMRLCKIRGGSDCEDEVQSQTLVALLCLLEGQMAFNNIFLRHHVFCILQILAGRPPTLYGVPRDPKPLLLGDAEGLHVQKNHFAAFLPESKSQEPPSDHPHNGVSVPETSRDALGAPEATMDELSAPAPGAGDGLSIAAPEASMDGLSVPAPGTRRDGLAFPEASKEDLGASEPPNDAFIGLGPLEPFSDHLVSVVDPSAGGLGTVETFKDVMPAVPEPSKDIMIVPERSKDILVVPEHSMDSLAVHEPSKEADTINSHRRKLPVVKIRVKRSATTSRAEEGDNQTVERSQGGHASSSVSVDAPHRNFREVVSLSNQNFEEVNSCHDRGSQMTASIGSAKFASDADDNIGKELQCTADSSKVSVQPQPDISSPSFMQDNQDAEVQKYASLQALSVPRNDLNGGSFGTVDVQPHGKEREKKKDKDKKRKRDKGHRDDPEYLERKRLKKEKKQKEKEMSKLLSESAKVPSLDIPSKEVLGMKSATLQLKPVEPSRSNKLVIRTVEATRPETSGASGTKTTTPKIRIKTKFRTLDKS